MKTLLPILKTKLFLLGFVSTCTVILATTVPQIRNFIAPEKAIGEKITTEQKKITPKIKKQNKTVNASRVTSGLSLEMNNSFEATITTDAPDYAPRSTATFTGAGFAPNEDVVLKVKNLSYPCNTVFADSSYLPWTVTADENGDFVTTWLVCDCPGDSLRLKATGQTSGSIATALFSDAAVTLTAATGGTAISADNVGGTYTNLTGPIITETTVGDIPTGTIVLNTPSGFVFDVGGTAPTVLITGDANAGKNINGVASGSTIPITVTSTTLTITITSKSGGGGTPNILTWQNIRVRPTASTPLTSGNITKTGTSGYSVNGGLTNYGTLTEVAGTATKFVITGSATQTAGTFQSLTITAKNSGGTTATAYTGTKSLTFSGANSSTSPVTAPTVTNSTGTATAFGAVTTITFTNGVATVSGSNNGSMTLYKAESATISASDGLISATGADQLSVTVSAAALGKFALSFTSPQTNGTAFTGTNTITAQDNFGNTITTFDASANNVTITSTPADGTITGLGSGSNAVLNQALDFSSGVANIAGSLKFTGTTGSHTFTATSATGSKTGTSNNVIINAGTATKLVITGSASQTAGTAQSLTITAKDVNGNIATTYTGSKSLTFSGANSSTSPVTAPTVTNSSGAAIAFGNTTAITFTNGIATVSAGNNGSIILYKAESATISATDGSISATGADQLSVTVSAAAASKLVFTTTPITTTAGIASSTITVQRQDAFGNPNTTDANRTVTLSSNSTGTVTFTPASPLTITSGNSSVNFTYTDTKAGTPTITAASTSPTTITSATQNETINVGVATKLVFTTTPITTTAGVASSTITVQRQDAFNNPNTTDADRDVTLSSNSTGTVTFTPASPLTITNGTSSVSFTYTDTKAGTPTITAASTSPTTITSATQNETITAGAANKLVFGVQPSNTAAAAAITPAVTVQILDANDNLTSSTASVTIAIGTNPGSGTLSGTATVAAVGGVATFSNLSINKTGTGYTLNASSGVLTGTTSNTFNITPGAANKLVFGQQPTNTAAGSSISPAITVQILDANNNLTTDTRNVTLAIATNPGGGTLSGTATVAAVGGIATFSNLSINKTGTGYTLAASSTPALTTATSNAFNITPGAATKLVFGQQPTTEVAGVAISPAVTVQIQDANNNLVTTDNTTQITLAIGTNPGGGTLSGTTTITASGGVATFSDLSINKTGTGYTLTASSNPSLTGATSTTFNITEGALAAFLVETAGGGAIGTQIAGISFNIKITAVDANDNIVTIFDGGNNKVNITSSGNLSSGSGNTVAFTNGVLTSHSVTISNTGNFTITATNGVSGVSNAFDVVAGAATKLVFTQQPTNTVAGSTITPAITVQIQDANNNLVTTNNTTQVTLAIGANPGSGTLSGTTTVTASGGIASFSDLSINKTGTGYTLAASSNPSLTGATSNTFNITPGTATKLVFGQQPTNTAAGSAITPAITVRVLDANDNLVTTDTRSITLAIGANPGSGTLSGTATVAATGGIATFSNLSINKTGTGYTLTASSTPALTGATSNTFNITPGAATKLVYGQQPTNTVAGTAITPAITVQILDANDNLVTTDTRNITLVIGSNPGGGTLSGTVTVAAVGGVATFSNLSINKTGTGYTLTASSTPALTGATSTAFNITVGAASKLVFTVQPSNTVAGATISAITVQVQDANGNLVTTDNTTQVTLAIGTNPGSGTLSGTTTVTASGGIATFSDLSINKSGTGYTLTASSVPSLTGATSNTFNITAGAANKLVFGVQPSNTAAGAAITPAITVQILDANDNLTSSTASVTIAIGTNPGGGTLSGTATVAAVGGVATFSNLSINKTGTGYTLNASSGVLAGTTSNTFNITPGAANKLVFGQQPTNTAAGSSITPAITVQILDANNNLVTTDTRNVTLAIGTNPGGGALSGTTAVAAVGGVATFSNLSINKTGTGYTLIASSTPALTGVTSNTFNITPGAATKLVFGQQPTTTVAGVSISPAITVQVQDANSNLVTTDNTTQITLAIGTNPGSGTLSGTTTVIASGGIATFSNLSINKTGTGYTLIASSTPALTGTTSNTFDILVGALDHFTFNTISSPQIAGTTFLVTITAQDANDNTVTAFSGGSNKVMVSAIGGTLTVGGGGASPSFTSGVLSNYSVAISPGATGVTLRALKNPSGPESGLSNAFDVNNPVPAITTISPTSVCAGGLAFTLTVNGSNFNTSSVVQFNGSNRTTTFVNAGQLTANITAADIASAGTPTITVFNPAPGGGTTSGITLTVNQKPTITAADLGPLNNDNNVCGKSITLDGTNITVNSGTPAPTYTYSLTNFGTLLTFPHVFPVGTTTVYVKASNLCGDDIKSFTVTVVDNQAPVITVCPGTQTLPLATDCSASVPDYTSLATATDNCPGVTISQSPLAGSSVSGTGTVTVTLTAKDASNNTSTCSFTVNKVDVTPPTITCPATQTVTLDADCEGALGNYTSLATSNDACSPTTVTQSPAAGSAANGTGTVTVTLTAKDGSNNTSTCSFTVNKVDVTPPTITCPPTQTVTLDASCEGTLGNYISLATVNDACSPTTVTQSPAAGTAANGTGTVTVTLTAKDASNNTSTCSFTVNKVDVTPPVITCPATQTVTLNSYCNGTLGNYIGLATVNDACSPTTVTQSPAAGTAANGTGTVTVTLTAKDASNNTSTCSFTVNKVDVTPPVITCPATQTVTLDADCEGTLGNYISLATVNDACSPTTVTQSPAAGTVANGTGTVTVTLTAKDASNNTSTCSFTVNKVDVTPPVITCPATQTVTLDADCEGTLGNYIGLATVNDACSPTTVTQSPVAGTAANGTGTVTVTLTAKDASNNTSTCSFTVNKVDVTPPVITCPATQTVTLNSYCNGTLGNYIGLATVNDACSPTTVTQSPAAGTAANGTGTVTVTLTAKDASNNTSTCSFTVNKVDVTPPVITCPATQTVTLDADCEGTLGNYIGLATVNEACSPTTVTQSPAAGTAANGTGTVTVTLTAKDASNNTSTCNFTVNKVDVTPPVITCPATQTVTLNSYCNGTLGNYIGLATVNDACSPTTVTQSPAAGTAANGTGSITVTLTAKDASNNTSTCSFTVNKVDVTPPVITCPATQTVTLNSYCNGTLGNYIGLATVNDACSPTTVTQSPAAGTPANGTGTVTVTLTAKDASNNTSTCSFTVNKVDVTPPVITCPPTQTVTLDADCEGTLGNYIGLPTVNDACSPTTVTQSPAAGTAANGTGTVTVTLTAKDASNNTSTCSFTVNKVDVTPPVITCPATQTVTLNSYCNGTLGNYTSLATANDACSPVTVTQSPVAGTAVSGTGTVTVTLTAKDASNNTSTCSFTVNKVDVTSPTITCPATQTVILDASCNGTLGNYISLATANDACSPTTVTQSPVANTAVSGTGTVTVTLTAKDASNNTSTCSFTVNKVDVTPPTITCPATQTVTLDASCNGTLGNYIGLATVNDACSPTTVTQSPAAGTAANGTGTVTVTLTAKDASNNTSTCSFTVNKVDVTSPTITCPALPYYTRSTDASQCDYTILATDPFNASTSDACGATTLTWCITNLNAATQTGTTTVVGKDLSFGTNTIKWTAKDAAGNTSTCSFTVDVNKITTTTSVTVTPSSQQYSDKITCVATITPYNCMGSTIGGTVTFKIGTLVLGTAPVASDGTATLANAALVEASLDPGNPTNGPLKPGVKTVVACYNGNDPYLASTSTQTNNLTITCEKAVLDYIGNELVATVSTTNLTANIDLRVAIQDIVDDSRGDIRNARVRFVFDGTEVLPYTPVTTLIDQYTGVVSKAVTKVLSGTSTSEVYELKVYVNNYYCSDVLCVPITVYVPTGDFITGGGHIKPTNSAGLLPSDPTSNTNFGFNVKYNKKGTSLQGKLNFIWRSGGKTYQAKSTAIDALGVDISNPAIATANFTSKCTVTDITDPDNPITVGPNLGGNRTMQVKMTDRGEPGINSDDIGFTLWNGNTLVYSSNWVATNTVNTLLAGGNLVVHSGFSVIPTNVNNNNTITRTEQVDIVPEVLPFNVKVFPNPSQDQFSLYLEGANNDKVHIVVYDALGREVKKFEKEGGNIPVIFGRDLKGGAYFVEVRQGDNRKTVKLVKQN